MADPTAILDWEQLDMVAFGYTPDFVEIYVEFLKQTPELLAQLREAEGAGDITQVAELAHKIKGSALNFGFVGVSSPMEELEVAAKGAKTLEGARESVQQAGENFEAARAEVAAARNI